MSAAPLETVYTERVERIVLGRGRHRLGAWRAAPATGRPRSMLVAIHSRAMSPGYFAGPVAPHASLLALASSLGHTVLAVERPGYGRSRSSLPLGLPLADQARLLRWALADYAELHPVGAGFFLLGHSDGGKTALHLAGEPWARFPPSACSDSTSTAAVGTTLQPPPTSPTL